MCETQIFVYKLEFLNFWKFTGLLDASFSTYSEKYIIKNLLFFLKGEINGFKYQKISLYGKSDKIVCSTDNYAKSKSDKSNNIRRNQFLMLHLHLGSEIGKFEENYQNCRGVHIQIFHLIYYNNAIF